MSRFAREFRAAEYARNAADERARIAAFAAIRRAVKFARDIDRCADNYAIVSHYRVSVAVDRERAHAIREAIRIAIESEKA